MADSDTQAGEPDSNRGLWLAIRRFFDTDDGERSLRAQLEEAIDEHSAAHSGEDEDTTANGDLSQVERQMLKNLLHFSEHDADDVAIPRGDIIALNAAASWDEVVIAIFLSGPELTTLPVKMWAGIRVQIDPTLAAISTISLLIILAAFAGSGLLNLLTARRRRAAELRAQKEFS